MAQDKFTTTSPSQQVLRELAQRSSSMTDQPNLPQIPNLEAPPMVQPLMSPERTTQPRQQPFPSAPIERDTTLGQAQEPPSTPLQSTFAVQAIKVNASLGETQELPPMPLEATFVIPAIKMGTSIKHDRWLESMAQEHGVKLSPEAVEGYHKIGNFSKEAAAYGGSTFGQYVAWCSQHGIPAAMAEEINLTGAPNDMLRNALQGVRRTNEQLSRLDPEMHKALGEAIKHMPAINLQGAESSGPDGLVAGAKPQTPEAGRGI